MNHVARPVHESFLEPIFARADGHAGRFFVDRLGGILLDFGFKGGKIHNGFHREAKEHVY